MSMAVSLELAAGQLTSPNAWKSPQAGPCVDRLSNATELAGRPLSQAAPSRGHRGTAGADWLQALQIVKSLGLWCKQPGHSHP